MAVPLPLIAYLGVSTSRQGRSGLGLEAQRDNIARFAQTAVVGVDNDAGASNGHVIDLPGSGAKAANEIQVSTPSQHVAIE